MTLNLSSANSLPQDAARALLIGRIWQPGVGPTLAVVHEGSLYDLSRLAPTASALLELEAPAAAVRHALQRHAVPRLVNLATVLANSDEAARDEAKPWLLAPCDLQAIKASGALTPSNVGPSPSWWQAAQALSNMRCAGPSSWPARSAAAWTARCAMACGSAGAGVKDAR